MKRILTLVLLFSICFAPQVLADEPTPPDTSSLDIPPIVSQIKASLNENIHDPGVALIEAIIAQLHEIKAVILGFGNGGNGGEVPSE